eukprot:3157746-Amphidinium_carterae.1
MFFSGLAWTYCKAGPPVHGANRARYELKTVMLMNTDVNKVMALQRVKDKAIRKRMEIECLNRQRGTNELEDEFHGTKKTNGSIGLVGFKCWNANENTDKYSTAEGKPSSAFRKKTAILLKTDKMHKKSLKHWQDRYCKIDPYVYQKLTCAYGVASDWVTSMGPDDNVAVLYSCASCNNAPLKRNGWLKAKTCSSGAYTKIQWHCPHRGSKWKWGTSAAD